MFWRYLIFGLTFFLYVVHASAQRSYFYTAYDSLTGAPFNEVFEVEHDLQGYIWIASDRGLFRFNGIEFEPYNLRLKSRTIHDFAVYHPDTLLFVNDLNVYSITYSEGSTAIVQEFLKHRPESTVDLHFPNQLFVDQARNVWISETDNRVIRYDPRTQISLILPLPKDTAQPEMKTFFIQDSYQTIWMVRHNGQILKYNDQTQQVELVANARSSVRSVFFQNDRFWLGSEGLVGYQIPKKDVLTSLTGTSMTNLSISAVYQSPDATWHLGTKEGHLYQKFPQTTDWLQIYGSNDPHRFIDLPLGAINQVYAHPVPNKQQLTWIAHQHGLHLLQNQFFDLPQGLAHDHTVALSDDGQGGLLVSFGDVHEIKKSPHWFESVKVSDFDRVTGISKSSGGIWLGNSYSELILLNRQYQVVRKIDLSNRGGALYSLFNDASNSLWFCQSPQDQPIVGVARLMPDGVIKEYGQEEGLDSRTLVVAQSDRGELYAAGIGIHSYLNRYIPTEDRFENISLPMPFDVDHRFEVHDIDIDARGVVWIASTNGLLTYDGEKIVRIPISPRDDQEVRAVGCTAGGGVWAATATNGVLYHQAGRSIMFDESNGLPSMVNSYRSLTVDEEGRIWIGTDEGVTHSTIINPDPFQTPMPGLRSIRVGDRDYALRPDAKIVLRSSQSLMVELMVHAFPASHLRLQYRIVPRKDLPLLHEEEAWIESSLPDAVTVNDLGAGSYVLQMRVKQKEGYEWSNPLQYELAVRWPFYRDPGFLLILGLLLIVLFWGYLRLFISKRVRNMENLLSRQRLQLRQKDEQLVAQTKEMDTQKEDYEEAVSNISILYGFIHQIPLQADWNFIIMSIGKALDAQQGIQAFELAYVKDTEICYRGYSTKEQGNFTFRSKPFDEKTSLTCWSIANQKNLIVNDFVKEHTQYVLPKEDYYYQSMAFVPFRLNSGRQAALCAYSIEVNQYQKHDILMLQILAAYVARSAGTDLK